MISQSSPAYTPQEDSGDLVCSQDRSISLVELKRLSETKLPQDSILRGLILSEPDSIPAESFFSKLAVWLNVLYAEPMKLKPTSKLSAFHLN